MESATTSSPGPGTYVKKYWWIAAIVVVVIGLITWFSVTNGVKNAGYQKEKDLNAQYNININTLSDCMVRIRESAGTVKAQTEAVNVVLENAVKGRYDGELSSAQAKPGPNTLFSAMHEAYPDLSSVAGGYDKVLIVINGCRTDYRGMQDKMQKMISDYESWRVGSWTTRTFASGFPSSELKAKKGNAVLKGEEALAQMETVVAVKEATSAYDSGELKAEDPFGTQKPGG